MRVAGAHGDVQARIACSPSEKVAVYAPPARRLVLDAQVARVRGAGAQRQRTPVGAVTANLGARLGAFVEKETNDLDTLGQACVQQRRAPVATMHTVNSIITVHT